MHEAVVRVNGVPAGNTRVVAMLPAGFEYVEGSATIDDKAASDSRKEMLGTVPVINVADGVLTAKLGELAPGSVRTLRFQTRAAASAGGEMSMRALAVFDSPAKSGLRTAPVESKLTRGAARYERSQFTFTPRFDVLKTELSLADENALRDLINSWRGARDISIRAAGHTDAQPISGRSRRVFADNYALSRARAQTVADYLAISLNVPATRVQVEGRGADEPVATGKDATSLAANRRVDIVIEGSRFAANAPLELNAAGGKADIVATQGVVLRGPATAQKRVKRSAAMEDKLGMGVVVDVEKLKPGFSLAGAARRCHAADFRHQGGDPASARPERGAQRQWPSGRSAGLRRRQHERREHGVGEPLARSGARRWQQPVRRARARRERQRSLARRTLGALWRWPGARRDRQVQPRSSRPTAAPARWSRCACSTSTASPRAPARWRPSPSIRRIARCGKSIS